jgi:protein PhnA
MAKGREEHEARVSALSMLGKDLARRAKSKCELCERGGEKLSIYEVPPVPRDPDIGRCLLLCGDCADQAADPRRFRNGGHWRFLSGQAWSENPMVQVMAVRLLRRLSKSQDWAREALDELFLDEEIEALVAEGE